METEKVRHYLKKMELSLKKHRVSGLDPIWVLDFVASFVEEANIQGIV